MRTLKSVSSLAESRGIYLFLAAFGSCFVLSGLWVAADTFRDGSLGLYSFHFGLLLFIGFGLTMVWGGLTQARLLGRFGRREATITPYAVAQGETFQFSYKMPVLRDAEVEYLGVFLVFRERVSYYEGSETQTRDIDRLFEKYVEEGRQYRANDTIEVRCRFRTPEGDIGIRNAYMSHKDAKVETMWAVKVRIYTGRGEDIWGEYDLSIGGLGLTPGARPLLTERVDVELTDVGKKKTLAVMKVLCDLLPHLRGEQAGDLYRTRPSLLLEGVTTAEAQEVKQRLEEVGATVSLLTGGVFCNGI